MPPRPTGRAVYAVPMTEHAVVTAGGAVGRHTRTTGGSGPQPEYPARPVGCGGMVLVLRDLYHWQLYGPGTIHHRDSPGLLSVPVTVCPAW